MTDFANDDYSFDEDHFEDRVDDYDDSVLLFPKVDEWHIRPVLSTEIGDTTPPVIYPKPYTPGPDEVWFKPYPLDNFPAELNPKNLDAMTAVVAMYRREGYEVRDIRFDDVSMGEWYSAFKLAALGAADDARIRRDDFRALLFHASQLKATQAAGVLILMAGYRISFDIAAQIVRENLEIEKAEALVAEYHQQKVQSLIPHNERLFAPLADTRQFIWDGFIKEASYNAGYAPSGTGKTLIAATIAVCFAQNLALLGRGLIQTEVIYFATEREDLSYQAIQATLHELAPGIEYKKSGIYIYPGALDLSTTDGKRRLDNIMARHPAAKLVIIDTLNSASDNDNKNQEYTKAFLECLDSAAKRTRAAFLVMHHSTKSNEDEFEGCGEWRNKADLFFRLKRGKDCAVMKVLKASPAVDGKTFAIPFGFSDMPPERVGVAPAGRFTTSDHQREDVEPPRFGFYSRHLVKPAAPAPQLVADEPDEDVIEEDQPDVAREPTNREKVLAFMGADRLKWFHFDEIREGTGIDDAVLRSLLHKMKATKKGRFYSLAARK